MLGLHGLGWPCTRACASSAMLVLGPEASRLLGAWVGLGLSPDRLGHRPGGSGMCVRVYTCVLWVSVPVYTCAYVLLGRPHWPQVLLLGPPPAVELQGWVPDQSPRSHWVSIFPTCLAGCGQWGLPGGKWMKRAWPRLA